MSKTSELLTKLGALEPRSAHDTLPVVWDRAKDHFVWDAEGNRYIDFTSGIFAANIGHSNECLLERLNLAMTLGPLHSYAYPTKIRGEYLERLTNWCGFEKAFLVSSGSEATEAALKIAKVYGARRGLRKVLSIEGAFHGKTMGAQLMGGGARHLRDDEDFYTICLDNMAVVPGDVCLLMIEGYQGWSARFHDAEQLYELAQRVRESGGLVCFDEIQSGFGRTGTKFAFQQYGIKPDLICVGKGMGGGFPISGVLGRAELLDLPGDLSSTHSGNPLACAAGLAVIEEMDRLDLVNESARKSMILREELAGRTPWHFTGRGLVGAILCPAPIADAVCAEAAHRGLLLVRTGRDSVKIGPPLTISDDALREGCSIIRDTFLQFAGDTIDAAFGCFGTSA